VNLTARGTVAPLPASQTPTIEGVLGRETDRAMDAS